jgi:transposase
VTKFRPYAPGQLLLLPPNLNDWLKEGHLALFISDMVDALDLGDFYADYTHETDRGYPAYHPAMMLKILLYAYCVGVMSSRKIEKACWDDIAFRVLSADQHPDHQSIARFRKRHLSALSKLFKQVLKLAQQAGMVKLGTVALDGTKIKANASKHKAMSYERMVETEKRLEKEIADLLNRAERVDGEEDQRYGADKLGDELPAELARRETRLATIQKAKAALEEEARRMAEAQKKRKPPKAAKNKNGKSGKPPKQGSAKHRVKSKKAKPDPKAQRNFTDPDSRIMWNTNSKSFEQSYNAQAVVDGEAQIIVATDVTQERNDKQQLKPMVREMRRNMSSDPDKLLADAGYCSDANLTDKAFEGIDLFIPPDRQTHGKLPSSPPKGRISKMLSATERMRRKLSTAKGKAVYRLRKSIVEPVFGQIKHARGFRQFLLRGLNNVTSEWDLVCLTHNIRKLFTKGWRPQTV